MESTRSSCRSTYAPSGSASFFDVLKATENCVGCTITMPHKQAAFAAADEVSERARRAKAVNIIRRSATGKLVGDMTDGIAMVAALKGHDVGIAGSHVLVVGAGGAGTAIAHAIGGGGRGVADHRSSATRCASGRLLADLARFYPGLAVHDRRPAGRPVDIAINASPTGMRPSDPYPFPARPARRGLDLRRRGHQAGRHALADRGRAARRRRSRPARRWRSRRCRSCCATCVSLRPSPKPARNHGLRRRKRRAGRQAG